MPPTDTRYTSREKASVFLERRRPLPVALDRVNTVVTDAVSPAIRALRFAEKLSLRKPISCAPRRVRGGGHRDLRKR
jgi:hypothetical protein